MDFYHVLPSNASPDYFPNNTASNFSTPLSLPYEFNGEWEVGLINLTYSTCVNTFNNDKIIVKERCTIAKCVTETTRPLKVMLPVQASDGSVQVRDALAEYINKHFDSVLQLTISDDKKWTTWKIVNKNYYFILSPGLEKMFQLETDILTDKDKSFKNNVSLFVSFVPTELSDCWIIVTPKAMIKHLALTNFEVFDHYSTKSIIIPPISFQDETAAISFLNNKINDERITFTCNAKKQVSLKVTDEALTTILDDTLHDIFAFDKQIFTGKTNYSGTAAMSLTRCIQYLYIYSNLGRNVRVGNTEAPLLAVIPFAHEQERKILTERNFKTPMYIRVKQNRVSQVDVAIYDGAGELVPFVRDAVTTLNLHFHQL